MAGNQEVDFRAIIEERSAYSIRLLNKAYILAHLQAIKSILHREDARASRLDMQAYSNYVDELSRDWLDEMNMGCCVVRKDDAEEVPVAIAIATKLEYRDGVRRPTELNWRRTQTYLGMEDQWCLDYVVRSRAHGGSGVGCFALAGLLEFFCIRFVHGMLWLVLAGGFENRSALAMYTSFGFIVTSLDADKTPIMSLQVEDVLQRVRRKLGEMLTLRHAGAGVAAGGGDDDNGGGGQVEVEGGGAHLADDGNSGDEDDQDDENGDAEIPRGVRHMPRRQRRRRREVDNQRRDNEARRRILDRLQFRTMSHHLRLTNSQLVLPPQPDGLEEDLVRHMCSMADMASINTNSQSFLIHLNVARQCHHIAFLRRCHVSRLIHSS